MKYVDKLLEETEYLSYVARLEEQEQNRKFCRHGLSHFLDVARIAWIKMLEDENVSIQKKNLEYKEQLYLVALLHDLGRIQEYDQGIPHHQAGSRLARVLLSQIDYSQKKTEEIIKAIENHRGDYKSNQDLIKRIREADQDSRTCFACKEQETCKWKKEEQNTVIRW
ncbi:MAG: HD domain-containing protein [Lachnospiraceae bacterium]